MMTKILAAAAAVAAIAMTSGCASSCAVPSAASQTPAVAADACCPDVHLTPAAPGAYPRLWNEKELFEVPEMTPATDLSFDFDYAANVKPVYLSGIDFQGKPTKFFAWVGLPEGADEAHPVPGVVLVHGGGGTAFVQWVEEWTARGYAAIAMDTVGTRPLKRFEGSGCAAAQPLDRPGRHNFDFDVANPKDSWTAHAVATVVKSHSYLRSLPQVDASRIGITGISWGGYLTCITTAVDKRFIAAVPVYGCGFLGEFQATVANAPRAWLELFDPAMFLRSVDCPILFVNRPVDPPYHWSQWVRSSQLPKNAQRSCRLGFGHSHAGGRVPEAPIFLDAYCKGEASLPRISEQRLSRDGKTVSATIKAMAPYERAVIAWTEDGETVPEHERNWQQAPAGIKGDKVSAPVPAKATAYFLSVYDLRNGVISTSGFGVKK